MRKLLLIIGLIISQFANAQLFEKVYLGYSTATPQKTMRSHLTFLSDENYQPKESAKTLKADDLSDARKIVLCKKLKEIYERKGLPEIEEIPNKKNYTEEGQNVYHPLSSYPDIYLKKYGRQWLYSEETVNNIGRIHKGIFSKGENISGSIFTEPAVPQDSTLCDTCHLSNDFLPEANLSSPFRSVVTLFSNLEPNNMYPSVAAKVIQDPSMPDAIKQRRVEQLKSVFDAKGIRIDPNDIPDIPNYVDDSTKGPRHKYVIAYKIPEIYLIKHDSVWVLSQQSLDNIEPLYKKTHFLGTKKLEQFANLMQDRYSEKIPVHFEEDTWRYIGVSAFLLSIILTSVVVYYLLKLIGFFAYRNNEENRKMFNKLLIPFSIYAVAWTLGKALPSLGLRTEILLTLLQISTIIRISFFITFFFRLVDFIVALGRKTYITKSTYKRGFVPFLGMAFKVVVLMIGIILILDMFGFGIKETMTGLSVLGLGLALAAQDTVRNFFGSVMIFLERPFQVGDWIKADQVNGDIESIGLRTTKIRTYDNSLISVPNSKLTDATLNNMGMRNYRRFKTRMTIKYSTPIDNIEAFLEELRTYISKHEYTFKDIIRIHMNDYGEFGYRILFDIFLDVEGYNQELEQRGKIIAHTVRMAQKHQVAFAIPFDLNGESTIES